MRIGMGFDIHKLVEGRPLMLGGVKIPHSKGLLGHSDADVLLHALTDAVLGASGAGDMGTYFPDTDPKWKGKSSIIFLEHAAELARRSNMQVVNADLTLIGEEPKMARYRRDIQDTIARALGVNHQRINLKAKTMEGLGPIGEGEAIAAYAVVLLDD